MGVGEPVEKELVGVVVGVSGGEMLGELVVGLEEQEGEELELSVGVGGGVGN